MRVQAVGAVLFLSSLIPLWGGCSGKQVQPCRPPLAADMRRDIGGVCVRDADCWSGFCDRGTCVFLAGPEGYYGAQCIPPGEDSSKTEGQSDCYGYLCIDRRCRSCQSSAECNGRSKCEGYWPTPGKQCAGISPTPAPYVDGVPHPPPAPPPELQFCPWMAPNLSPVPNEKQVSAGMLCMHDTDCRSGLCDRGICGDPYQVGNYGRECVPGPSPPIPPEDLAQKAYLHVTPFGRNLCTGYLCLGGRCRSCQSDADCQGEGSGGPQCLKYPDWPGKRCGTLAEAREVGGQQINGIPVSAPPSPLQPPPRPTGSSPLPKP